MTGEPIHTASKERILPELMFSSEQVPLTDAKVKWPLWSLSTFLAHYIT